MDKKKKRAIWWIAGGAALVVIIIVILLLAFKSNGRPIVEADLVQLSDKLTAIVTASGEIKPKNYVDLQSEITGVITELYVKEGDSVRKGDVLLKIDPFQTEADARSAEYQFRATEEEARNTKHQIEEAKLNLRITEANLRSARAELDQAQINLEHEASLFKRKQQLHEDNLVSREEYDLARSSFRLAESRVEAAKARLSELETRIEVSKVNIQQMENSYQAAASRVGQFQAMLDRARDLLNKTVLTSPLTGVITKLEVEKGERAVPGMMFNPSATLMTIADLSVIEAEVKVDETDIVNVKLNQPVIVKVDALPDRPLNGHVTEIGNSAITTGTTTTTDQAKDFKVVVQLDNPPVQLRPGLSATAEITTAVKENILAVPLQAVVMREVELDGIGGVVHPWQKKDAKKEKDAKKPKLVEKQGVFKVDKENRVVFVLVETGITGETKIEILKGLTKGDEIVVGSFKTLRNLKDGDFVQKRRPGTGPARDEEQSS
ncbi:MAG TPA: efflux RND transporter periplasmic adaptor subunit [Acidobacteriota bacterium]|nr:HlyD family efflux transporter periplasmic adaptor subunit [Acidobacteriota bacterium]HOT00293.1 efflux RND transporter periplasmic adaptor subunit [Acidobacteriota bacterium]HQF86232.1 efflux RND transporter periplasmic adaptor subunit [Acidobacteriota bacterium]HQG90524.1 efflux RND transporter periplasmic adaptor subunit [Acidobacteriota bacterium]